MFMSAVREEVVPVYNGSTLLCVRMVLEWCKDCVIMV